MTQLDNQTRIDDLLPPDEVAALPSLHRRIAETFISMVEDYPIDGHVSERLGGRPDLHHSMDIGNPRYHKSEHWDQFTEAFIKSLLMPEYWEDFRNNGLNSGMESKTTARQLQDGIRKGSVFRNYAEQMGYSVDVSYHSLTDQERQIVDQPTITGLENEYVLLSGRVGEGQLDQFFDIDIGRPIYFPSNDRKLNSIDMRNAYYTCRVQNLVKTANIKPRVIAEIGGGFGGLAGNLKQLYGEATIILLDLPETLTIQMYYLKKRFPQARCLDILDIKNDPDCLRNLNGIDFVFLPGWEIVRLPDRCIDVWSNTESFGEMFRPISDGYVKEAGRTAQLQGVFYCHNRYAKKSSGTQYRFKDLAFDDHWLVLFGREGLKRSNYEVGLMRTEDPVAYPFSRWNREVPPYDFKDLWSLIVRFVELALRLSKGDGNISANTGFTGHLRNAVKQTRIALGKLKNSAMGRN